MPMRSTRPLQTGLFSGILKSWYFKELLPELITKMFILKILALNCCNNNSVKNIINRAATA
ncbi:hypothetical protein D3C85_1528910 [compost metagenome]